MKTFERARLVMLSLVASLAVLSAGCQSPRAAARPAIGSAFSTQQGTDAQTEARVREQCGPLGQPVPRRGEAARMGPTRLVARDGFVLLHSSADKIPLWVCERITREACEGSLERSDDFRPDPLLPKGERAELADYRGSGYDRGHMAPAGDQMQDARLKDETFVLSNMVPQLPRLNRGPWAGLEEQVREKAIRAGQVYAITGPLFYDPREDDPATADGLVEFWVIGPGAVAVPTHTYKIALYQGPDGAWRAVAWAMPNSGNYGASVNFDEYRVTIDFLERHTGFNFFPAVDEASDEAARLEGAVGSLD